MRTFMNGYPITAPFGSVDPSHGVPHKGVDFGAPLGTPIPSIGDGVVSAVTNEGNKSFGLAVHIHMKDGTDVIYGHLSSSQLHAGQIIHAGDIIGSSGSTGDSTGPHLHLQMMQNGVPVDPLQHIPQQLSTWGRVRQFFENGHYHANSAGVVLPPDHSLSAYIQSIAGLSLTGFVIALSAMFFGLKVGRRWTIRFLTSYLILTVLGASFDGV